MPSRPSSTTALRHALAKSDDVLEIGRDDFPLPTLDARLARIEEELINGRGFVRLRGVDRNAYTQAEMEVIYWGIGMHLGLPWPQNKYGHVLGDVTDQNKATNDPDCPRQRARRCRAAVPLRRLRSRRADVPGERPQRRAVSGRELGPHPQPISWSIVPTSPPRCTTHFPYDFRGEEATGGKPFYSLPVFTEWDGRLFVRCIPPYIYASQRHPDAPRLTDVQHEALQAVVHMADDPREPCAHGSAAR